MNSKGAIGLLAASSSLVACKDLGELASVAARLTQAALDASETCVLLRSADGDFLGGCAAPGAGLEAWVQDLLRENPSAQIVTSGKHIAVGIEAEASGVRGVLAVSSPVLTADEVQRVLPGVSALIAVCADAIAARARESRALKEAQAFIAKGLHDLRTPLNSLRLGMHLLAPGLANQDPAVVNRTHRAIDRMAALVTEMFDALHKT